MLVAIASVAVFGAASLAVDLGAAWAEKAKARGAVDAAALAASDVAAGGGDAAAAAGTYASNNGFASPTVHAPPSTGPYAGSANCVEVVVQDQIPTIFGGVLGRSQIAVSARAVACASTGSGPCALCVLSPSMTAALSGTGNGSVTVRNGEVRVNSTAATAARLTGNGSVTATAISGPAAPGGFKTVGNARFQPTPVQQTAVPDPLASLPACPSSSCPTTQQADVSITGNGSSTISPGVYGSISVTGNGSITLQPGTYVITRSLSITGNGNITGNGVALYLACSSYPTACTAGQSGATMTLTGNGSYRVSAPTSGTYKGLSVFADRNNAASSSLTGNGSSFGGTLYLRSGGLTLTGNGGTLNSLVVIDHVTFTGNGALVLDRQGATNVAVPGASTLVE